MNRKTISNAIYRKVTGWINSIQDEKLKNELSYGDNIIVTGGCITSMLLNEEINDYDIYFKTREITLKVAEYYVKLFKDTHEKSKLEIFVEHKDKDNKDLERIKIYVRSRGIAEDTDEEFENNSISIFDNNIKEDNDDAPVKNPKEYKPKYLSANAITLSDNIQLIIRFYGNPEEIHKNYDFIHCTNYWTMQTGLVLKTEALESILAKELKYVGSKYPLCSVIRTRKFIKRGWFCSAGQYLKMLYQISKMNLNDINILEDQLIGVDSAYFNQVIEVLKKDIDSGNIKLFENGCMDIDNTYLGELIDKIF